MTPYLRAIQTVYRGYRFRSRLEARWAVFFDAIDLPWEYEPEGYELPSGRYLPDFFLRTLDSYFEVKGKEPTQSELDRAKELAWISEKSVWFLRNIPEPCEALEISGFDMRATHDLVWEGPVETIGAFAKCTSCGHGHLVMPPGFWFSNLRWIGVECPMCGHWYDEFYRYSDFENEGWFNDHPILNMRDGLSAARSARFEYGEAPA